MLYSIKIAWRYLSSGKAQTALLVAGVAAGVFVFIFMSALIGGLASYLVQRTVGDISHVTIKPPDRDATLLLEDGRTVHLVQQRATTQRDTLRNAEAFLPGIEATAGVRAVSPQIVGNGGVIIGASLAADLQVDVGQVITLQSDRGIERPLVVAGLFTIGVDALDSRAAFVSLATARTLFELPQGLSRVEIKLEDLNSADDYARRLAAETGLTAESWTTGNAQLLDGLRAQASSGNLIKGFALVTIVIGVASALLLSTYRRRSEIGIMRAFGASRGFVVAVFVLQGALIGVLGGLIGAALGYLALSPFPIPEEAQAGGLPVDVRQGAYGLAISLTAIGAILASILPARAAARVDPVSVIGQ